MKVLIIQPWISYRGAESVSLEEARGLKKIGHKATVLCLYADRKRLKQEDKRTSFILPPNYIARFCQRSNIFFFLFGAFILLWLVLRHGRKFDVYNPHNFPSVWIAVLVGKLFKKRVYWTVHNFPQHGFTDPLASKLWERATWKIDQLIVSRVTKILTVSEKVARQVNKTYKKSASVVYPPVDFDFFSKAVVSVAPPFIEKNNYPVVLIPARLHEVKNQKLALEAIKKYFTFKKHAYFIFAGDGPLKSKLEKEIVSNKLAKFIHLVGFVSKDELRRYYRLADLVFLPGYVGEGFNIVVLEALSQGVPSLVLRGSGVDEWLEVNKAGFVTERSINEIAMRLKYLLSNKNLLKITGEKGKKIVKKKHTPQYFASKLVAEFNI